MENNFINELKDGFEGDCPCCGRYSKVYKRRPHANMIKQLIQLYKLNGHINYIHTSKFIKGTTDAGVCTLRYWGLIERSVNNNESKKNSGLWKITQLGVDFINQEAEIKEYALVFDDRVMGFAGEYINVEQCLAEKFDYKQLMRM